jgi:hypothetical protein
MYQSDLSFHSLRNTLYSACLPLSTTTLWPTHARSVAGTLMTSSAWGRLHQPPLHTTRHRTAAATGHGSQTSVELHAVLVTWISMDCSG